MLNFILYELQFIFHYYNEYDKSFYNDMLFATSGFAVVGFTTGVTG